MFGDQATQKQFEPSTFFFTFSPFIHFDFSLYVCYFKASPTSFKKSVLTTKCIEKTLKMTQIHQEHIFFIYCLKILQK